MVEEPQWPPPNVVVHQALGVTAEELNCTVPEAFAALVAHAAVTGQNLDRVAITVVDHPSRCSAVTRPLA